VHAQLVQPSSDFVEFVVQVALTFFTALLLNSYWALQLPALYGFVRMSASQIPQMTKGQFIRGACIGLISCFDSAGRALALNSLPGSLFVIFSSSDMAFNYLLSKTFLKKQFTW